MNVKEEVLFPEFAARCDEARASLRHHMTERGLHERDGWRIYEFTRDLNGRTELVLRPVHPSLSAPDDLECVCTIDEPGSQVSSDCSG